MKLIATAAALASLLAGHASLASAQDAECVAGAFAFTFSGACTAAAVVAAYADQVFDMPGATSKTCQIDAAADLTAKLAAAGLTDPAGLCGAVYSSQERVPFTDAAKRGDDLAFEKLFYDGRTDWQEEVETTSETADGTATSVLREDAAQVRTFFRGTAQGRRVAWPGSLSNFQSSVADDDGEPTCATNAAMCCWPKDRQANDNNGNCATPYDQNCVDNDPGDNTNLCFVDPARGNASTGYDAPDGVLVYPNDNGDGEGAVHCHGLAWSNDVNSPLSRYKANNLFFVSMYDHMHQRGYVQNIPGAPMCGCVEQMPTVSRSDCTQVDLTETVKITYDPDDAETPFTSKITHVDVDFNACQGINNRNNDLWAYMARLYYQGDVTPQQFGEAGRIITDNGCHEATKFQLNSIGMSVGYHHDAATWTKVAGRDAMFDSHPYGTTAFNTVLFDHSLTKDTHPIILRTCPYCRESHQKIYYRRLTAAPAGFDILNNILRYRHSNPATGNKWKEDFTLHSTYEDAVSGANPWQCPNDAFNYHAMFDGECSPSGARVRDQYSIWWHSGPQQDVAYFVNAPDGAGVDHSDSAAATLLGAQYSHANLGNPTHTGRVLVRNSDGAILMSGSGHDIWGQKDYGHYLSEPYTGDVDVRVHVSAFTGIARSWAKAGIMFRGDGGGSAPHVFAILSGNEGVLLQARRSEGGHSNTAGSTHRETPRQKSSWLRLVKHGDRATFYWKNAEDDEWVEHASQIIRFPEDAFRVGLAVSSQHNSYVSEAVFEDYTVGPLAVPTPSPTGSAPPTAWEPLVMMGGARAGTYSHNDANGISYYQAYGTGIWGTSDSFLYRNVRADHLDAFDVVAYSNRFHTGHNYAKAGIMIRDGHAPDAAHAFLGVSGYYAGVTFQYRRAAGEATVHHSTRWVPDHKAWMKLSKAAGSNVLTAYYKAHADDEWTEIGSQEIQLSGGIVTVGTAITSGDASGNGRADYQEMGFALTDTGNTEARMLRV